MASRLLGRNFTKKTQCSVPLDCYLESILNFTLLSILFTYTLCWYIQLSQNNQTCLLFSNEKVIFKICKNKSVYCPYSLHFLILSLTQLKTGSVGSIYILWENICCFLLNEITSICLFSLGLGLSASNLAHLRILSSLCLQKKKKNGFKYLINNSKLFIAKTTETKKYVWK